MVEVDWQSLFASFYSMVRIKVKCRDPKKIPGQRAMEMADELFLINFTVEGLGNDKVEKEVEGDSGDDEDGFEHDDLLDEENGEKDGEPDKGKKGGKGDKERKSENEMEQNPSDSGQKGGSATKGGKSMRKLCFELEEGEEEISQQKIRESCTNFLRDMELDVSEEGGHASMETDLQLEEDQEMLMLPTEWVTLMEEQSKVAAGLDVITDDNTVGSGITRSVGGEEKEKKKSYAKALKWGPVVPERKSSRVPVDGRTALEKAQAVKRKNYLEVELECRMEKCGFDSKQDRWYSSKLEAALPSGQMGGVRQLLFKAEKRSSATWKNSLKTSLMDGPKLYVFDNACNWEEKKVPSEVEALLREEWEETLATDKWIDLREIVSN